MTGEIGAPIHSRSFFAELLARDVAAGSRSIAGKALPVVTPFAVELIAPFAPFAARAFADVVPAPTTMPDARAGCASPLISVRPSMIAMTNNSTPSTPVLRGSCLAASVSFCTNCCASCPLIIPPDHSAE